MVEFTVRRHYQCPACQGMGQIANSDDGGVDRCATCGGDGKYWHVVSVEDAALELGWTPPNMQTAVAVADAGPASVTAALVAIVEQLTAINESLAGLAGDVSFVVANRV